MEDNNFFHKQFGFRMGHLNDHILMTLINSIYPSCNDIVLVFLFLTLNIFYTFFLVFIVDFEQVNISWDDSFKQNKYTLYAFSWIYQKLSIPMTIIFLTNLYKFILNKFTRHKKQSQLVFKSLLKKNIVCTNRKHKKIKTLVYPRDSY